MHMKTNIPPHGACQIAFSLFTVPQFLTVKKPLDKPSTPNYNHTIKTAFHPSAKCHRENGKRFLTITRPGVHESPERRVSKSICFVIKGTGNYQKRLEKSSFSSLGAGGRTFKSCHPDQKPAVFLRKQPVFNFYHIFVSVIYVRF